MEIPIYDPNSITDIIEEYGVDENTAIIIASSTMDGANEDEYGIQARQTNCDVLRYKETIVRSREQIMAQVLCEGLVADWLKANNFSSVDDYIAKTINKN